MDDNRFGVPAGWYPDPLGLPQLRWWDAQAWTEHTSEARAPIVIQPATRLGFADDEPETPRLRFADDDEPDLPQFADDDLPSRREQRERERRENPDPLPAELQTEPDSVHDELSAQPLLAMTLLELEPPLGDTVDEAAPGPKSASSHANAVPAASTLSALAEEEAPAREIKRTKSYTVAVWAIALMPLLQLLSNTVLIAVLGLGSNLALILLVSAFPFFLVLGFAFYDRLLLQVWGHDRPASALWAFLGQPGYLVVRAIRTFKQTGRGFAPLAVWASSLPVVLVAMVALPGLLIALFPDGFSNEIEQSVRADAAALGADITLDCPSPPLLIGDTFTCHATKPNGDTDAIAISLQRENGWIAWRVEDWGLWVLTD